MNKNTDNDLKLVDKGEFNKLIETYKKNPSLID